MERRVFLQLQTDADLVAFTPNTAGPLKDQSELALYVPTSASVHRVLAERSSRSPTAVRSIDTFSFDYHFPGSRPRALSPL